MYENRGKMWSNVPVKYFLFLLRSYTLIFEQEVQKKALKIDRSVIYSRREKKKGGSRMRRIKWRSLDVISV